MTGPDQGWQQGQQYGYVDGTSADGAVSDLARRVSDLEVRAERGDKMEGQPKTPGEAVAWWERWMDEHVKWEVQAHACGLKHWGVWHPKHGWTWAYGIVFSTENKAIAEAQREVSGQIMGSKDSDLWEVRCIEEWAEEMG